MREMENREGKNLKFVLYGLLSVEDVLCPCLIKSCQRLWQRQRQRQRQCDGRMKRMKKKRMMIRLLKD